jgi:hypothetical protein
MLVIRREQLSALGREPRLQFEGELVQHGFQFYPDECNLIGRAEVLKLAQSAIEISTQQGFPLEREIAYFFSLMFMLGIDFYRDPQLPWNWESGDTTLAERVGSMHAFFGAAMKYIDLIAGPSNERLIRAMIRVKNYDLRTAPARGGEFEDNLCGVFEKFFPEKYAYQGEAVTRALIRAGIKEARQYGIEDNQGILSYTGLMFMVGSGMHQDPLYPWISRTLNDPKLSAGTIRGGRLFQAAGEHIAQSLETRP